MSIAEKSGILVSNNQLHIIQHFDPEIGGGVEVVGVGVRQGEKFGLVMG